MKQRLGIQKLSGDGYISGCFVYTFSDSLILCHLLALDFEPEFSFNSKSFNFGCASVGTVKSL